MSVLTGRAQPKRRADLGLAGKLAGSKGAIRKVFCLRMVDKTGKGGPQLLAAWPQERAEV
jgi:hypothetical protein